MNTFLLKINMCRVILIDKKYKLQINSILSGIIDFFYTSTHLHTHTHTHTYTNTHIHTQYQICTYTVKHLNPQSYTCVYIQCMSYIHILYTHVHTVTLYIHPYLTTYVLTNTHLHVYTVKHTHTHLSTYIEKCNV